MKITFALPTNRGFQAETLESAMKMVAENKQYDWHIICPSEGYDISQNRNYIAVQAARNKSDWLIMIDDDMVFNPETINKLISNNKDICGVAYHSRGSVDKIKLVEDDIMAIAETEQGKYINLETNPDPKYKDVFECYATGTGIMLIRTEIFWKIPQPWFAFEYYENGACKQGEDWTWCLKAKKYGFKTFCDPTIYVGHLGDFVF